MLIFHPHRGRQLMALTLSMGLAACAEPSIPAAPTETSALTGKITQGTVVAIRSVHTGPGDNAAGAINAVLQALAQPPLHNPITADEIVVERDNKSSISLTPGTVTVSVGDQVTIVEAGTTSVHPN